MGIYETNKDLKADTSSLEVITDCMNFLKALNNCVGIQAVRGESELERSIRSGTDSRILSATHVRRYDEDIRAAMMRLLGTMGGFVESWRL